MSRSGQRSAVSFQRSAFSTLHAPAALSMEPLTATKLLAISYWLLALLMRLRRNPSSHGLLQVALLKTTAEGKLKHCFS